MIISTLPNKISACHHENLDLSLWKSAPFIIKSRPVIMKISTFVLNDAPYKITEVACKFATKWLRHKIFSGNYQKNGTPLTKHFDTVFIYQDFTLYLSCKPKLYYRDAASIDFTLHNKGTIPTQTISLIYAPKLLKESLVFRTCLIVGSFFLRLKTTTMCFKLNIFNKNFTGNILEIL